MREGISSSDSDPIYFALSDTMLDFLFQNQNWLLIKSGKGNELSLTVIPTKLKPITFVISIPSRLDNGASPTRSLNSSCKDATFRPTYFPCLKGTSRPKEICLSVNSKSPFTSE